MNEHGTARLYDERVERFVKKIQKLQQLQQPQRLLDARSPSPDDDNFICNTKHLLLKKDEHALWLFDFTQLVKNASTASASSPSRNKRSLPIGFDRDSIIASEKRLKSVRSGTTVLPDAQTPTYKMYNERDFPLLKRVELVSKSDSRHRNSSIRNLLSSSSKMASLNHSVESTLTEPAVTKPQSRPLLPSIFKQSGFHEESTSFLTQVPSSAVEDSEPTVNTGLAKLKIAQAISRGKKLHIGVGKTLNDVLPEQPSLDDEKLIKTGNSRYKIDDNFKRIVSEMGAAILTDDQAILVLKGLDPKEAEKRRLMEERTNMPVPIPEIIQVTVNTWSDVMNISRKKKHLECGSILNQREKDREKICQEREELSKIMQRAELKGYTWKHFRMNNLSKSVDELWGAPSQLLQAKENKWARRKAFYNELIYMLNNSKPTNNQKTRYRNISQGTMTNPLAEGGQPISKQQDNCLPSIEPRSTLTSMASSTSLRELLNPSLNTDNTRAIMNTVHRYMTSAEEWDVDKKFFFTIVAEIGMETFFKDIAGFVLLEKIKEKCNISEQEYEEFREKQYAKRSMSRFLRRYDKHNQPQQKKSARYDTFSAKLSARKQEIENNSPRSPRKLTPL